MRMCWVNAFHGGFDTLWNKHTPNWIYLAYVRSVIFCSHSLLNNT